MYFIRFANPNYHAILIHFPLGLMGVGLIIEVLSFLWRGSSARVAARWMILLGALGTIPAVTSGIYAKHDVMRKMAGSEGGEWHDLRSDAGLSGEQWKLLNDHVLYGSIGSGLAVLAVILWMGGTDGWRKTFYLPAMLMLVASYGVMGYAAYNAGEMVYRTQMATMSQGTADEQLQAYKSDLADAKASGDKARERELLLNYYVSPVQIHVVGAGLVLAIEAAALGLALRKGAIWRQRVGVVAEQEAWQAVTEPGEKAPPRLPAGVARPRVMALEDVPAAKVWLVGALFALLTVASGWFLITSGPDDPSFFKFGEVYNSQIKPTPDEHGVRSYRMLAHLVLGGSLVVLALLLAGISRSKSRMAVGIFGLLTVAVALAQIWVGILILYDTDTGPLNHFNSESTPANVG